MAPVRMRESKLPSRRGIIRTPPQQKGIQRRPLMARSARRSMMATSAQVDVLQKVRKILDKGKINESQNNPVGIRRLDSKLSVVVRVRPLNPREMTSHAREIVLPVTRQVLLFDPPRPANTTYFKNRPLKDLGNSHAKPKNATYGFDRVYFNQDTNDLIYNEVMKPLIGTLLQGYNCSVFAYGSTGSGKTYTMLGGQESPGLTVLTLRDLYQQLDASKDDYESDVIVSYLEVYNEQISDLLNKSSGPLQIRDAGRGNEAVIVNLSEHRPPSVEALLQLLQAGNGNRTQHATDLNAESSRSHAVLMVRISMRDKHRNMDTVSKKAKLVMVDLAGSEKGSATGFTGERFREGTNINKSLLSLANCISALSGGKACASFRDSKLTRILKDSLSGNCRTVMVANVSPADTMKEDTLNTLKYASQAKKITLQASQNAMTVQTCLSNFTRVVEEMAEKIEHLQDEQVTTKELVQTLENQLEEYRAQKDEKDQEIFELKEKLRTVQQDAKCTWRKLPPATNKLNTSSSSTSLASEQIQSSLSTATAIEYPRTSETNRSASNNSENPGDTIMPESVLETKLRPLVDVQEQLSDYTCHVTQTSKRLVANLFNLKRMLLDVQLKYNRHSTFTTLLTETGDERYETALEKTMNKINSAERLTDMYKDNFNNIENDSLGFILSEQFWTENVAPMDQSFQISSMQLRALKLAEVQLAIKYEQVVRGFLWLQNRMSKKMESQEEMLKDSFLVINELKNYLRHKELDVNEASPRLKKLMDSFLGVPSVRFANVGNSDEGDLFEDDVLDEPFEDMLTPSEWLAYKTMTGEKDMEKLINESLNDDDKAVELPNEDVTNSTATDPSKEPSDADMNGRELLDTDISLGVIVGGPEPFSILEGPQGFSLPIVSLPEDKAIQINPIPDDCTDSSKPILASVAASADPIKFYGLDKSTDEVDILTVEFETADDLQKEQTTEWVGNTTIDIATNNNDMTSEDLQSQTKIIPVAALPHHVPNPFSAQNYMPPPLTQVLKTNNNVNADVTFVASGTKNLESTYVKETGDTEENLSPPTTQTKLPNISDLVDKLSNNTGAITNPKKDVKSGRPETIVPQVKKGIASSCSPPKRFRLGGSQGQVPGGSAQKPTPTFQAPRTTTWKKTPHATIPTSRSIPSKKGSFGPPKPNQ